ncbi:MAG: FliM/FliN family flagellar motor C-terminal domain-containing protein, partial [Candidatus Marsarchaeota archaeon]|nr:FliM/FliN family flagellar motor C-terminal domain-containing protein [Candidatus Marsarchaeota archaeon]
WSSDVCSSDLEKGRKESLFDTHRRLLDIPMDVVFQFPSILTTPAELLTLQVGDSLGLGHPKGRPLEVRAEGILVALADICSSGVHKACEIREEVNK